MKEIRILFIDDDNFFYELCAGKIIRSRSDLSIQPAINYTMAELFIEQKAFDIVVMDGNLGGGQLETLPLVKKLKAFFKGPIIANSSHEGNMKALMESGCTHAVELKEKCIEKVLEVIDELRNAA